MRKSILTTAITTALLGGMAFNVQAQTEPQGMYSADDILDAEVFFANGSGEEIGEVDDILFDEIVVNTDQFTLETHTENDGDTEHRIMLEATSEEVESFPTYDRDWWEQTKANARDAWQTTKEGAQSAWQSTREAIDANE